MLADQETTNPPSVPSLPAPSVVADADAVVPALGAAGRPAPRRPDKACRLVSAYQQTLVREPCLSTLDDLVVNSSHRIVNGTNNRFSSYQTLSKKSNTTLMIPHRLENNLICQGLSLSLSLSLMSQMSVDHLSSAFSVVQRHLTFESRPLCIWLF